MFTLNKQKISQKISEFSLGLWMTDLANKNRKQPIKFESQINNKKISRNVFHAASGTYIC